MKKIVAMLVMATMVFAGCGGSQTEEMPEAVQEVHEAEEEKIVEEVVEAAEEHGEAVQRIKDAGKLVMYTNAEFPPYEYLENNEIVGVDVEIGKKIAAELGVELEIVNAEFAGIVAAIASGKGDIAITGMTITEERQESVDFSVPYVDSVQYLILKEGSEIKVMEDLEGRTIGSQEGTTGAMLVEDEINDGVLTDKNVTMNQYKSAPTAMQDLINGRIDAVVIDELVAQSIAKENDGYVAVPFVYASGEPVTEQFGVVLPKNHIDLLTVVDKVVVDMVQAGEIDKLIEQFSQGE